MSKLLHLRAFAATIEAFKGNKLPALRRAAHTAIIATSTSLVRLEFGRDSYLHQDIVIIVVVQIGQCVIQVHEPGVLTGLLDDAAVQSKIVVRIRKGNDRRQVI